MKLLVFSDIHGDVRALNALMDIEAGHYFAAGDLVSWARGFDRIGPALARRAGRVHVLPGNHESEADVARLCETYGLDAFHGKTMAISGYHVAGLGYSNPTPFDTPGEYTEEEIAQRLNAFSGLRPLILVCHCPPLGTPLDRARENVHLGSHAVREFVDREQPAWFFCGHIHEAEGATAVLGAARGVNVGKRGYLLDLPALEP